MQLVTIGEQGRIFSQETPEAETCTDALHIGFEN